MVFNFKNQRSFKFVILTFIILFLSFQASYSQLLISNAIKTNTDAETLIKDFLLGNGITISSVSWSGFYFTTNNSGQIASFNNGNSTNLGIKKGIIMSTGDVLGAPGPNDNDRATTDWYCVCSEIYDPYDICYTYQIASCQHTDNDLESLLVGASGQSYDAAVLEFDFIPASTPITFKYVFASEEYPEYVCSDFNDVFGFFITSLQSDGYNYNKKNIALIPGTNLPVAINTVNLGVAGIQPGTGECNLSYSNYYVDNGDGKIPNPNSSVQYDGFTKVLTAKVDVIPCKKYHIKLSIADLYDGQFDSAVFLEAGSFSSPSASISKTYNNSNVDTLALEGGCNDARVCFNLTTPQSTDMVIPLNYKGSTTDTTGLDYPVLPKSITIPANQLQACFNISPIADGITEGTEKIVINAKTSSCGYSKTTVHVFDYIPLTATPNPSGISICEGGNTTISVTAGGGISNKPYKYLWSNALGTGNSANVSPLTTTTYTVTVTDACGSNAKASIEVKVNPKPVIKLSKDTSICIGGSAIITASGAGVGGNYLWNTGQNTATITVTPNIITTYTVTATTSFGCSSSALSIVKVNPLPLVTAVALNDKLCAGDAVEIDAGGAVNYVWSSAPVDNSLTPQKTKPNPVVKPLMTTTYTVIGTNANSCSNSASVVVNVKSPPVTGMKDTSICLGGTANLKVTVPGAGISYIWNTGANGNTITITPVSTTTYTVTVTESTYGCQTAVSAKVNVVLLPVAEAGANQAICKGIGTSFTASGGSKYLWNTGDNSATINVNPLLTTKYTVTVSDVIGCSAKDSVVLTVNDNPVVNAGKDTSICKGFSVPLTATSSPNVTYNWNNSENTQSITVNPINNASYSVTVTDINGCKANDQVNVNVNSNPVPLGQDKEICMGGSATLIVSGAGVGGTYVWNTGDITPSITVNPVVTTTYYVTLTNTNGCKADTSYSVTVHSNPVAILPADYSICTGSSTTITALGAGINGTYKWSTGAGGAVLNVNPLNTTTYIVTVTDQYTCTDSDEIIISVNSNPTADAGKDTAICAGFSANLLAKGGLNYLWSTGETTAGIEVTPQSTTVYLLTVTDNNGCTGKGSVKVTVNPIPTSFFSISPSPICIKQITTITFTGSAAASATYNWNIDGDNTKTGPGPFQLSWNIVGSKNITLTIIDKGCVSLLTSNSIQVNDLPVADFTAMNVSGCQPLTVAFTDISTQTNFSSTYLWDFGDGHTSTDQNPVHTYIESGKFTVKLKVANAAVSCDDIKSIPDMIDVFPKPDARYYVQPNSIVSELNPTVFVFSNSIGKIVSYKWTLSDKDTVYSDSSFTHVFKDVGTYNVTLVVTSDIGCIDSTSGQIIVKKDFTIYIPSAFMPGKCKEAENCWFRVRGTNISNFKLTIFNRWGAIIFTSADMNDGWDGKINGSPAEIGIYPYRVDYRDANLKSHTLYGQVTLLR